jgi:hypothetical protein
LTDRKETIMRKLTSIFFAFTLVAMPLLAGGALETQDITGNVASPIPGHIEARLVPIRWDVRAIPVNYSINTTQSPVPNPLGAPFLSLAAAQTALQESFDQWNQIPTSYIDMRITGTTTNAGVAGFDFVNELTFRTSVGFNAIASSPSVSLIRDVTLVDGDDIDGDGDSDVSSAITVATDVDGDGDIEFPAGFYKAGTILDNDVQFNTKATNGFRFTIGDAALDTVTRSVDLHTVAVHEFGHSFGLSHSMNNQESDVHGDGATMFPFIDTGDPDAEKAQRTINIDDIAWASYFYPEGTAATGPAALQAGDIAFSKQFGLITGEIRHGVFNNEPVAGANVFTQVHGGVVQGPSGYSGTVRLSRAPNGGLSLVSPEWNIIDGRYTIPVPKGNWNVGIEPVDGNPAAATNISLTCQVGGLFGQLNFNEEFYNGSNEGGVELRPGQRRNVPVNPGRVATGINITTSKAINLNNFGNRNFMGFIGSPAGRMYAVRVPAAQVQGVRPGLPILVHGAAFDTSVVNASVPVVFSEAVLTTGSVSSDGSTASIDLSSPLHREAPFLAQENDFAPLYVPEPHDLGRTVRSLTDAGVDLFMVLRLPMTVPFQGVSGQPPLIGLDGGVPTNDVPIFGLSYLSDNGGATWTRTNLYNFRFSLVLSEPVK